MFPDPHLQRPVRRVLIIFTFLVALGWIPTKGEEPAPFRCPRATMAYDPANPSQSIGSFHEGTELRLAPWPADPGLRLAVCRDDGGREVRALCRATDLGLDSALPRKTASSSPGSPSESTEADGRVQSLEEVNVGLFGDGPIFEKNPGQLAGQLRLPKETETRYLSIYRSYSPSDIEFFGQRPTMVALYGNPDHVSEVNLMFLNDGDYFGADRVSTGTKKFRPTSESRREDRNFREALRDQEDLFMKNLTRMLGHPTDATMGMGKARERVSRWDFGKVSLLLSVQENRYLALRVWPKSMADNRGLPPGLTDEKLREQCRANVVTRPNGDLIIEQIPMINQGPKGYCVPATYERVLRYLGMTADMYSLALIGKTERGSGTQLSQINDGINNILQRSGRQIRSGIKLQSSDLKRWVGTGIPLLWEVSVLPEIEQLSAAMTASRKSAATAAEWKAELRRFPLQKSLRADPHRAHVRLIIGFNEATQEIAYSDSWGVEHAECWLPLSVARQITLMDGLSAITW